jgi:hypothetical protein
MDPGRAITIDELQLAIRQGKERKVPGIDGICHEFFQHTWDVTKNDILSILNSMFIDGSKTTGPYTSKQDETLDTCYTKP